MHTYTYTCICVCSQPACHEGNPCDAVVFRARDPACFVDSARSGSYLRGAKSSNMQAAPQANRPGGS